MKEEALESIYYSPHFKTLCKLPLDRVVEFTCGDIIPSSIEFTVELLHVDFKHLLQKDGKSPDNQSARLNDLCASTVFVNFFEKYRALVEKTWTEQAQNWPQVFNFARVLRNAVAHSGCIHFDREIKYSVRWRGFLYAYANQDQQVVGRDFFAADFIFLMMDMAKQLDAVPVPIIR